MRALVKIGFGMLLLAVLLVGAAYAVMRSHAVRGVVVTEGRTLSSETRAVARNITSVDLSGPIDLTLRYGPTPSLVVRGEQRLLGNIETTQDGNQLHIGPRGLLLNHHHPLQATLVLPALASLTVNGSGDSTVDGFSGDAVTLQLDGSGSVKFNGRYRRVNAALHGSGDLDIDVGNSDRVTAELVGSGALTLAGGCTELKAEASGSGELNAQHLRADSVGVRQTGTGSTSVTAQKSVALSMSGTGDIEVRGNPAQRSVSRSGTGDVSFSE
jgi:Putative auto-transporter adhesin, head GIN domain